MEIYGVTQPQMEGLQAQVWFEAEKVHTIASAHSLALVSTPPLNETVKMTELMQQQCKRIAYEYDTSTTAMLARWNGDDMCLHR